MKKVLFLPFLQISSGHHQVANALIANIKKIDPSIQCKKVDILTYTFGNLESLISGAYLRWINLAPGLYSWLYKKSVYEQLDKNKRFFFYECLFLKSMFNLIREEQPDLVICSHSLPSYLLNRLKLNGRINVPVINAYTDFFIHHIWGISAIEYHFVPNGALKKWLMQKGVDEKRIWVTGIPVHPEIERRESMFQHKKKYNVLVTGGSLGVGPMDTLLNTPFQMNRLHYYVLCGKNEKLYYRIKKLNRETVTPLPYISSRAEMNTLYDKMDAVLSKPGGVTVSECIMKRLPFFIYHALPGQEELNMDYLTKAGIAFRLPEWKMKQHENRLLSFLDCPTKKEEYINAIRRCFSERIDLSSSLKMVLQSCVSGDGKM
ncbi:MGDG synthase family glycosyltransferase [Fictibacillus gelatini]|uniref:MGDG synthase family glycosyltransferase n=1 Tax=Fictibacillus gelatini TaxID=225985 RepID=UPI0003FF7408|nr:hypothetical protein [Fictibacillus gelatini]